MKIYVNREPVSGPWGGGNKTLSGLCERLRLENYEVTFDLENDAKILFCFDPRRSQKGCDYSSLLAHKKATGSVIIHRVGDVGTHSKPDLTSLLIDCLPNSDRIIFTSNWAKNYLKYDRDNCTVIENGSIPIFYKNRIKNKKIGEKIKVVTHHWSDNPKKGFDIYSFLGQSIDDNLLDCIEFTYIGRYSKHYATKGIKVISPVDKDTLSSLLPEHDIYLTASLEEAGANHVLEAMACGLPVLYRKGGGSIEEYCKDHGVCYENNTVSLFNGLIKLSSNYSFYKDRVSNYKRTLEDTLDEYMEIIKREASKFKY